MIVALLAAGLLGALGAAGRAGPFVMQRPLHPADRFGMSLQILLQIASEAFHASLLIVLPVDRLRLVPVADILRFGGPAAHLDARIALARARVALDVAAGALP